MYYLLEAEGFDCWLVNAREVKNVPGRAKTRLVDRTIAAILGRVRAGVGFGWLGSLLVIGDGDLPRDLAGLVVPRRGCLEATGDLFQPYRLVDGDGAVVVPVAAFFAELAACGRPATTQRSYGMDLLRWFRFLWALGVGWDQATRVEARDFCRWLQVAVKPARPHWRHPDGDVSRIGSRSRTGAGGERGDRQGCSR